MSYPCSLSRDQQDHEPAPSSEFLKSLSGALTCDIILSFRQNGLSCRIQIWELYFKRRGRQTPKHGQTNEISNIHLYLPHMVENIHRESKRKHYTLVHIFAKY